MFLSFAAVAMCAKVIPPAPLCPIPVIDRPFDHVIVFFINMCLLSFNSLQKKEHFNTFNNTYIYITIKYSTPPTPKATKDNKKQKQNNITWSHTA